MIAYSSALQSENSMPYTSFLGSNIDSKEDLLELFSTSNLISIYIFIFIAIFIYLLIAYFISNMIDAFILGVIGYLFARVVKLRLRYKATFNIGIYAQTLPIALSLIYIIVNTFTNFEISHFQWMYTTISYIYVAVAILMIKTEILNQRIQLIRLKQIQEQAAKDAETEEENEQNKEEKKEKKEEPKEDKKEEKEEEGTGGKEPGCSNA